jgi:diguanylate cyclase (GGDEF)-like protein
MAFNVALNSNGTDFFEFFQRTPRQRGSAGLIQRLVTINQLASELSAASDLERLLQCLTSAYAHWFPDGTIRLHLPDQVPAHGPAARAMQSGIPILVDDSFSAEDPICEEEHLAWIPRSIMALPLQASDRALGVLEIFSSQPNRFHSLDYHLSLLVAANVASALENLLTRQELMETNGRLVDQERKLMKLNKRLRELVHTDDLTGLFNRRRLMVQLDTEIARVRRYGGTFSCIMIDVDGFKQINDTCGHPVGDQVLRQIANLFRCCCRATDVIARYGGDEIVVLLPETDAQGAACVGRKLRQEVKDQIFVDGTGRKILLSISVGIVSCSDPASLDAAEVITRADQALYSAKRAGGDRLFEAGPDDQGQEIGNAMILD